MNWSGNFREGLTHEIRENKTLAKITAYTVTRFQNIVEVLERNELIATWYNTVGFSWIAV